MFFKKTACEKTCLGPLSKLKILFEVPEDTPFDACATKEVDGTLEQRNTLDQFHNQFLVLKRQYETPSAMCGYFSIANATLVSRELPSRRTILREELNQVFAQLENVEASILYPHGPKNPKNPDKKKNP